MKASIRRTEILTLMDREGNVTVDYLVEKYQVSEETIRRDLRLLDEDGYIKRVHGGAEKLKTTTRYLPSDQRRSIQTNEKEAIGKACLSYLEEDDSVFIDGKTTCQVLADLIPDDLRLTIVTNSIIVARHLMDKKYLKVHIVGGELNQDDGLMTGHKLIQELKGYRFDKAIFSCIGVDVTGCYFAKMDAQQLAYTLKEISSKLILLADSSKINQYAFLFGLDLDSFSHIITDEKAPDSFVEKVQQNSCHLVRASLA
ncbi:DeoR/GlpR family DNA-binding transcription regulator [Alteribacillus sp. YIM 98480]|uniref:DeoR/GlpR family DNA-binding transcription regulator n=1 Tax=Alteribacillus sp. YIM 98480 TaxID=2606599 RepID=UPI00131D085B|nr:DeoR/GlpR family DNA-binding transcription regulator [Alteribacillus sp. YIM 98480]